MPNHANILGSLHLDELYNHVLAMDAELIPLAEVVHDFLPLGQLICFSIRFGSDREVLSQLGKSNSFLLVVLLVESEHVFVLTYEVIVQKNLCIGGLIDFMRRKSCDHHE